MDTDIVTLLCDVKEIVVVATHDEPDIETVMELDSSFLCVLDELINLTLQVTSDAVQQIMHASSGFIDETVQKAITDFHQLYSQATAQQTIDINHEVDALMEEIKNQIDLDPESKVKLVEDEEKRKARLSLSGVQKRLETLIQFDTNAKEKLIPVLMSMQFEDEQRQVLHHINAIWRLIASDVLQQDGDYQAVVDHLKGMVCTRFEKELFYHFVLKEPAPQSILEDDSEFTSFIKGLL